jgi:hypothetical protein
MNYNKILIYFINKKKLIKNSINKTSLNFKKVKKIRGNLIMVNRLYLQYNYDSSNLSFSKLRIINNLGLFPYVGISPLPP